VNINSPKKVKILILASGNGSNAENIINYFRDKFYEIEWFIITNNNKAGVIEKSKKLNIPFLILNKDQFNSNSALIEIEKFNPSLIILAGFLLKISENIIEKFPDKIINIHPSLLPAYGGKGMYGMNVHNKIIENSEKESGITIHYVNKNYDEGRIIFQKKLTIQYPCNSEELAKNIHVLEMEFFPKIIEDLIKVLSNE
jgi:phosphoribosylglycinamide formyltransferase-1|tara:strand:- start:236 stop:832 length:597 start_codon:yes stop_codon:yes gene_type:complete